MRARITIAQARTRSAVRIITATTTGFALLLLAADRPFLTPFDSTFGQLVLLAIGALFAAGYTWLARLARLPELPRVITTPAQTAPSIPAPRPARSRRDPA